MQSGVYLIRNSASGKVYVGSARYISKRWSQHRCSLRRGQHHALRLQRAWKKYGEQAFSFELVESAIDARERIAREQYWMAVTQCCDPAHGYNVCPTAGSSRGLKWTKEQRAQQSETGKRIGISAECRLAQKQVFRGDVARAAQAKTVAARKAAGTYAHCEATRRKLSMVSATKKLSDDTLREIAVRLAAGEKQRAIAVLFDVHLNTIGNIKRGKHPGAIYASVQQGTEGVAG